MVALNDLAQYSKNSDIIASDKMSMFYTNDS